MPCLPKDNLEFHILNLYRTYRSFDVPDRLSGRPRCFELKASGAASRPYAGDGKGQTVTSRALSCRCNQQRYRDRQTQKISDLRHQVSILESALHEKVGASPSESGSMNELQTRLRGQNHTSSIDPSSRSDSDQSMASPQHISSLAGTREQHLKHLVGQLLRTSGTNVERREVFLADVDQAQDTFQVMNASSGRCTSSLTYGIIGSINPDRTMALNVPPSDIVPFLRQTPESLAKILFWRSMTTAFRAGQEALEQYRRDGRRQWVANQGILTLPFLLEGVETVLKWINFRLSFFEDRVVDADDAGRDLDAAARLRHTIVRHMEQAKVPVEDFIDAHEAQRLLIEQIGSEKVATLATAAAGALEDAKAFASHSWVEQLAARSVCLGAGHQWRREVVLEAFRDSPHLL